MLIKENLAGLLLNPPRDHKPLLAYPETQKLEVGRPSGQPDEIVGFLAGQEDLATHPPAIQPWIITSPLVWICYHKGTSRVKTGINRDTINARCKQDGLQGVAMISIEDDWSALRVRKIQ